jgi:hypothetical protein
MNFGYSIFLQKLLKIQTAGDSLVLADNFNVRFDGTTLTVFDGDKSLFYDGGRLVLKSLGVDPIIVTPMGPFPSSLTGNGRMSTSWESPESMAKSSTGRIRSRFIPEQRHRKSFVRTR